MQFDIVTVLDTPRTRELEVGSASGVVIGMSPGSYADDAPVYAVMIEELDATVMLSADDLKPTGDTVPREAIYDGSAIQVTDEGHVLPYQSHQPDEDDGE